MPCCDYEKSNEWYRDIEINDNILSQTPESENVHSVLRSLNLTTSVEENASEIEGIFDTGVPTVRQLNQQIQIPSTGGIERVTLNYPEIDDQLIDEFKTPGYIAWAFSWLYPTGRADLRKNRGRLIKNNDGEYFKHMMRYKDGRFATDTVFRFFALNSLMR